MGDLDFVIISAYGVMTFSYLNEEQVSRRSYHNYKVRQFLFCAKPGDFLRIDNDRIVFKTLPVDMGWDRN